MTAECTIVRATMKDLDEIVAVANASFSNPWTGKMFEAELTGNPFAVLTLARPAKDAVQTQAEPTLWGYLCFWSVFEELRLMDLAVHPGVRRRGVARRLVAHALCAGREAGAMRALLEVRASNEPARRLYSEFGFRCVGERAQYYSHPTEDAALMELSPLAAFDEWGGGTSSDREVRHAER